MKKKNKVKKVALMDVKEEAILERHSKQHYDILTPTDEMELDDLIDWLAVIAADGGKWSWIRRELLRRFTEMRRQFLRQQKSYDELWNAHYNDLDRLEGELAEVKLVAAQDEQEHADTVAGLKMQLEELEKRIAEMEQPCNSTVDTVGN